MNTIQPTLAMTNAWTIYESPLGPLTLVGGPSGLRELRFPGRAATLDGQARDDEAFAPAIGELAEYFAGVRTRFDVPLDLRGTAFQRRVWAVLSRIPFGATRTYGEIASATGRPDGIRAAAAAVGRTPTPIIVPCHRVLSSTGHLTGYGGGLDRKAALLELEAAISRGEPVPRLRTRRQLTLL